MQWFWGYQHTTVSNKQIILKISQDIIGQIDQTDVYGAFYANSTEYTLVFSVHEVYSRIDYVLDHKSSTDKF